MLPSEYLMQGFCQNVLSTDEFGNAAPTHGTPETMLNFPSTRFSILGAISKSCSDEMYFSGKYNQLVHATASLAYEQLSFVGKANLKNPSTTENEQHHFDVIWAYNNMPGRTQKEAMALMQNAENQISDLAKYTQ